VRSGKTSGDLGKIYRYDLGLNRIGFYTQNLRLADSTDHVLAFDYYADSVLVLAGGKNHLVTTAKELPDLEIRLTDITAAIHDIEIVGTVIYLATSHGILYSTLGNATGIYDTLDETSEHRVNSLDYSKEANLLVSGFDDSRIILFKPDTTGMPPRIDTILVNHNDKVADVEFSASGKYLASGGWDNKVIIWERDQEEWRVHGTHPHNNDVLDVQFYNDSLLLSASVDRTVQLYKDSLEQFVRIPSLISHTSAITAATFANTDDGLYVISGDRSGRLRKWNIEAFDHLMKSRTYNEIAGAEANFEASKRFRCTTWKLETKSNEVPETIEFSASDSEFETDFVWWKRWRRVLGVKSPWGKGKYEILDSGKIEFQTGQPEDSIRTFTYQIHNDTLLTDSTTLIIGSAALILTEESGKEVRYRRKR
ncbi:MAG: hypothetical protein OEQ53_17015, partial [Saprospiraceae bacterium]|nr:hypothetical protein [Saprospiraceae bacterium]